MQKCIVQINECGSIFWFKEGTSILHREDGPALQYSIHDEWWNKTYKIVETLSSSTDSDKLYSLYINNNFKSKWWYKNGLLEREDGPAVEYADGTKFWLIRGLAHREDGPAKEYANGQMAWFLNGKQCSKRNFDSLMLLDK